MARYNREDPRTALPQLEKELKGDIENGEKRIEELEKRTDGYADYIVEQGKSGIWTYRKWASGMAECWGEYSFSSSASSVWVTPIYISATVPRQTYPFEFKSTPMEWASVSASANACWLYGESTGTNTTTQTAEYKPVKVNAFGTNTFKVRYYIKGEY